MIKRFWNKVIKTETCWVWNASKSGGYGIFWWDKKRQGAHRVAYEWAKGKIPKGLEIDHLCKNPSCVNPEHLEAVTHHTNILRGKQTKTHCLRGHILKGENIKYRPSGERFCIACGVLYRKRSAALRIKRSKNHCIKGHEYTPENTKALSNGSRACRICVRASNRRSHIRCKPSLKSQNARGEPENSPGA